MEFYRLQPDVDIMIHITALKAMRAELVDLGINITEHALITTINCSVSPVRYESLLGAWENVPDGERTVGSTRTIPLRSTPTGSETNG